MPMRSRSRKRAPQAEIERFLWRLDITCEACQKRTGRPHRIGVVYRRPNMKAVGTDMFFSPPLKAFEGPDGTKIRPFAPPAKTAAKGLSPPSSIGRRWFTASGSWSCRAYTRQEGLSKPTVHV